MAHSNTISQTLFDTRKVIDNAARRCKLPAQSITAEHIEIAKDQLYLILSDLANQGAPLWCIEKQIYPLYEGINSITMDVGTVDILNSNLRNLQEVSGTNTDTSTSRTILFDGSTAVNTVGIKWSAASAPISLDRSVDNITWTTIQTENPEAVSGEWTWFDLDSVVAANYFRVRATSGTLDFETIYTANTPTEVALSRMNRDDYTNLPNKTFQSTRPLQFWFDRQIPRPIMRIWPAPNASAEFNQIVLWRQRHIMDVGSMTQEIEVPQRWLQAIVSLLAARLASELVEVDPQLIPMLDGKAASDLYIAQMEERDNSPMMLSPNVAMYTA